MSSGSRRRLMCKFASLDWNRLACEETPIWFITLTTPIEYWDSQLEVYRGLRRFADCLQYRFGHEEHFGAFVRQERGSKRGMLHYHIVLIGASECNTSRFRHWVRVNWTRALRYEGGLVRVDVQPVDNAQRVGKYLSKYCVKVGYEGAGPAGSDASDPAGAGAGSETLSKAHNVGNGGYTGGRSWYVWGSASLPWAEVELIVDDSVALAKRVRRIFRRWLVSKVQERNRRLLGRHAAGQIPVKRIAKALPFFEFLRSGAGGFTLLASPSMLELCLDAAAAAVVDGGFCQPYAYHR